MRATPFSAFVSKTVIVGALCALLWVVRPAGSQAAQEKSPHPASPVATKIVTPAATEIAIPRARIVELPARPVAVKQEATYHSASDRPDLAMPSWKSSNLMRVGFPM